MKRFTLKMWELLQRERERERQREREREKERERERERQKERNRQTNRQTDRQTQNYIFSRWRLWRGSTWKCESHWRLSPILVSEEMSKRSQCTLGNEEQYRKKRRHCGSPALIMNTCLFPDLETARTFFLFHLTSQKLCFCVSLALIMMKEHAVS